MESSNSLMIHLDTNYLIRALVPNTPKPLQIEAWIGEYQTFAMSSMGWCELLCGPLSDSQNLLASSMLSGVEPITAGDAKLAAELFNKSGRRCGSLGDCIIASVAMRLGASLATDNRRDFAPFTSDGLKIIP